MNEIHVYVCMLDVCLTTFNSIRSGNFRFFVSARVVDYARSNWFMLVEMLE